MRREALMIRMRGERHLLREEWVEDVEGKDKDLDGDLWKKKKLLLRKEWFEDVEGKRERLDGCCARPNYHAPGQKG